jgi:hypothetical protein
MVTRLAWRRASARQVLSRLACGGRRTVVRSPSPLLGYCRARGYSVLILRPQGV